jgi:hypothetical protein
MSDGMLEAVLSFLRRRSGAIDPVSQVHKSIVCRMLAEEDDQGCEAVYT